MRLRVGISLVAEVGADILEVCNDTQCFKVWLWNVSLHVYRGTVLLWSSTDAASDIWLVEGGVRVISEMSPSRCNAREGQR